MDQINTTPVTSAGTFKDEFLAQRNASKSTAHLDFRGKTILIVEDILSNFQLLQAYLSPTEVGILHAFNGAQALEILKANRNISLVLMDLRLPDVNGLIVTRMIRKVDPTLPIIAQTAYAMPTDRQECLSSGCNDYIAKPIRRADFIGLIEKYLLVG